jgi:2-polyprenyl-6-methoxyphenol hydroxylase-like FAD-dependent oxidoreductase
LIPGPRAEDSLEVIVIGAGVAGSLAATVLGRQGRRVLLLDPLASCPPVFKGEKLAFPELQVLRDLGLFKSILPLCGHAFETMVAYNGRIYKRSRVEQIGFAYADLVNGIRRNLPETVETRLGRVKRIGREDGVSRLELDNGETLTARLVVLACGIGNGLLTGLGLRRRVIQKEQCVVLGFDIAAGGASPLPLEWVTYYPTGTEFGIDYLTLFKIGRIMRANLFTFPLNNDPWIRQFHQTPGPLLERALPKLARVIGEYQIKSKVESGRVDLYRMEGNLPDGVILLGDALQNACPATGLGFKNVFNDVEVLAECVPRWFATSDMTAESLRRFYEHPRKRLMAAHILRTAFRLRRAATDRSLPWRLYRALLHVRRSFSFWIRALGDVGGQMLPSSAQESVPTPMALIAGGANEEDSFFPAQTVTLARGGCSSWSRQNDRLALGCPTVPQC